MNDLTYIQEKFVNYIEKIIQSNKLSHSYLIELGDFSLDFPLVLLFVKMILCSEMVDDVENLNCNRCNTCKLIDENSFPDLQIIEAEGSQIKKNQLLSLKGEYQNKSLIGKRRVYIIKNAEKLNPSSANTILKFLEEPEEGVIAILLTSNRYQILDTILSRCQVLSLLDDSETEIVDDKIIVFMRYLIHPEDLFIHYKEIYDSILSDKETAREIFFAVEKILINYLSTKSRNKNSSIFSFLDNVNANILLSYITIIE